MHLSDGKQHWFVKLNSADRLAMFEAEAAGLEEIANTGTIRVPRPLLTGSQEGRSYIVMEYIPMGRGSGRAMSLAGEQLAALHHATAEAFGWHRDNTIGSTPQPNAWSNDWVAFWREHRLGFQLHLAVRNGAPRMVVDKGERLQADLEAFFTDYRPVPSLLHGDLWGGNQGVATTGEPVIFDPAVYYGDREADLAMTELFGGFGRDFHAAYDEAWPRDPGYAVRKTLYNLYHILNHFNLFGGGYLSQAQAMMESLLSEVR